MCNIKVPIKEKITVERGHNISYEIEKVILDKVKDSSFFVYYSPATGCFELDRSSTKDYSLINYFKAGMIIAQELEDRRIHPIIEEIEGDQ
jgi:hypothetical protein